MRFRVPSKGSLLMLLNAGQLEIEGDCGLRV